MKEPDGTAPHAAVLAVAKRAVADEAKSTDRLAAHGILPSEIEAAISAIRTNARLTLNFHPDRRDSRERTVAAGLAADGAYRSQFDTGISNGQRTAVAGGDRDRWEAELFDNTYASGSPSRPVYGALDLFGDSFGGAPRFGSCFVVLKSTCLDRATFCVGDSHLGPTDVGTSAALTSILAGAVDGCVDGAGFGRQLDPPSFLERLATPTLPEQSARELNHYIEAQVHGSLDLARDVATVVLDPSFFGTEIERDMHDAALGHDFAITWHEGSEVEPAEIDPNFRGRHIAALAHHTVRPDGRVDAAAIGRALDDLAFTPPSLAGDPEDSPRQQYKKLWHCCVRFGVSAGGDRH